MSACIVRLTLMLDDKGLEFFVKDDNKVGYINILNKTILLTVHYMGYLSAETRSNHGVIRVLRLIPCCVALEGRMRLFCCYYIEHGSFAVHGRYGGKNHR